MLRCQEHAVTYKEIWYKFTRKDGGKKENILLKWNLLTDFNIMLSANDCTSQQNYTALCHFLSGAQNSRRGNESKHYMALFVRPLPTCPIGLGGGVNGDRRESRVVKAKCCYVAFKYR